MFCAMMSFFNDGPLVLVDFAQHTLAQVGSVGRGDKGTDRTCLGDLAVAGVELLQGADSASSSPPQPALPNYSGYRAAPVTERHVHPRKHGCLSGPARHHNMAHSQVNMLPYTAARLWREKLCKAEYMLLLFNV